MLDMRSERADHEPWPTSHVEDGVLRARPDGLDDHLQRALVGDRRGRAEYCRLTGELVEDQLSVVGFSHSAPILSQRSVRQYQHFAVAAALLRSDQRRSDLLDRVEGIDRRLEHAVADFAASSA